jgi:glycosyltransferase involved in cell wall biosynthesis
MKVLAFPRDANPYQELLYSEMRKLGVRVSYLGGLTPFHTVNILLLPLETAIRRLFGPALVHIHWVAPFKLPGSRRVAFMRRASQEWFSFWLKVSVFAGVRLVWTAHNVLPHEPIFADDVAARRVLVNSSDLVIMHSAETCTGLAEIGAKPRRVAVIPHGPFSVVRPTGATAEAAESANHFRLLFIGRVKAYKGVEELLDAFTRLSPSVSAHLTVVGQCTEPELLDRLGSFTSHPAISMHVGPERLPDAALSAYLADADAVVLPFRVITTSGSAILAISHGKPLIVPAAASMLDIPESAAIRYDGTQDGLTNAMARAASMSTIELAAMSEAAFKYAHRISWEEIAVQTRTVMNALRDAVD